MTIFGILGIVGGLGGVGLTVASFLVPGFGAVLGKIAAGALQFLSKLPPWVFIVAAALAFSGYCWWAKDHQASKDAKVIAGWQHKAEDSHHAFVLEKGQFAIQTANLNAANGRIEAQNKVVRQQGILLDQMTRDAAANDARNAKLARSTDQQIAALRSAATQHKTPCTLSDAARRELEN